MTPADIKTLAAQAACFTCLPVNTQQAIKTYLLAVIAGGSRDPKTLLAQSRAFIGIPSGMQPAVQTYATAVLAGGTTVPSTFVKSQACVFECTPGGLSLPIAIYQLATRANLAPVPKTLAALASCFVCIPDGYLVALQSYLLAVIAGVTTIPGDLLKKATGFINTIPSGKNPGDTAIIVWLGGCPVPSGLVSTVNADLSITVTWSNTPANVDFTEIWWSSDNVTFTQIDSVAAPANSVILQPSGFTNTYIEARFCTGTPTVLYPLSDAWFSRVAANGGPTPSSLTRAALHGFEAAISGIKSRIYHLNPIAPDSLIAALTPFIVTNGSTLWTKHLVGAPPAESITVAGLQAASSDIDGTIYDTGVLASAVAAWTATNGGMSVYVGDAVPPTSANNLSGCFDGVSATFGLQANNGGVANGFCWDSTQKTTVTFAAKGGFFSICRTAAALVTAYFANAANAWGSIATNVTNTGRTPPAQNIGVCGEIDAGPAYKPNRARISFVAYHDGFSSADAESLYVAVNNLRHLLGGGFV